MNGAATTRDGWGNWIMERCEICGERFEKVHKKQVLCGDRECLRRKKLENGKDWKRIRSKNYMAGYERCMHAQFRRLAFSR